MIFTSFHGKESNMIKIKTEIKTDKIILISVFSYLLKLKWLINYDLKFTLSLISSSA
jgi:hypothetical protein